MPAIVVIGYLPKAVLSAIVFVALRGLIRNLREGWRLWSEGMLWDLLVWACLAWCGAVGRGRGDGGARLRAPNRTSR